MRVGDLVACVMIKFLENVMRGCVLVLDTKMGLEAVRCVSCMAWLESRMIVQVHYDRGVL